MANTKVPIELSSTPGIVDNSTATAITIDGTGAATFATTTTLTNGDLYVNKIGGNSTIYTNTDTSVNGSGINSTILGQSWLYGANWGASDGRFVIYDSTVGAERFSIAPTTGAATFSGNVGIGISAPTSKLSLYGIQAAIDFQRGTGDSKWELSSDSLNMYISEMSTGTRNNVMALSETGNLGIGTNTPAYQLTLSSNQSFWEAGLQTEVVGGNQVLKIVSDAFGGGGRTGSIEFHVNSVSASPAVKINSAGAANFTNEVQTTGKNFFVNQAGTDAIDTGAQLQLGAYSVIKATAPVGSSGGTAFWTYNGSAWGERMRIDASGNLLVGTTATIGTNALGKVQIRGGESYITINDEVAGYVGLNSNADNSVAIWADPDNLRTGSHIVFYVDGVSEKMRINSSGGMISTVSSSSFSYDARQTGTNGYGILSRFSAAGLGYMYSAYLDSPGAYKFYVTTDGAVYGNGTYGTISDIKLKENIVPASSQWDDVKAIQLKNYSLIADNLDHADQLGVIAQDLEASGMGKLIDTLDDIDGDGASLGTVTKHVKYSVLHLKALGALQEAMAKIEDLTARLEALEGA